MNKRQRKTIDSILTSTPIIAFTFQETEIEEGQTFSLTNHPFEEKYTLRMNQHYRTTPYHRDIKKEVVTSLADFLDNYIMCGGVEIFILTQENQHYQVKLKLNKQDWNKNYWKNRDKKQVLKEDPFAIDDDSMALFTYICNIYNKLNPVKAAYKLF